MVLKPPHRQKLFVQAVITMATLRHQATFSQIEYFYKSLGDQGTQTLAGFHVSPLVLVKLVFENLCFCGGRKKRGYP